MAEQSMTEDFESQKDLPFYPVRTFDTYSDIVKYVERTETSLEDSLCDFKILNKIILKGFSSDDLIPEDKVAIESFSRNLATLFRTKISRHGNVKIFLEKHQPWLQSEVNWPELDVEINRIVKRKPKPKKYPENRQDPSKPLDKIPYTFSTYADIFEFLRKEGPSDKVAVQSYSLLEDYILKQCPNDLPEEDKEEIDSFAKKVTAAINKKFVHVERDRDAFYKTHRFWLAYGVQWPKCIAVDLYLLVGRGRLNPVTTAKREIKDFINDVSIEQITAALVAKQAKNNDMSFIVDYLLKNPDNVEEVKEFLNRKKRKINESTD